MMSESLFILKLASASSLTGTERWTCVIDISHLHVKIQYISRSKIPPYGTPLSATILIRIARVLAFNVDSFLIRTKCAKIGFLYKL